ncbi:hypothetical protein ABR35_06615 [Enterobacter cloacae subsp. cloacae]|nr:hypothetical protein ABR35_06615 [Enterobacter cloacae subsp. cloacae]
MVWILHIYSIIGIKGDNPFIDTFILQHKKIRRFYNKAIFQLEEFFINFWQTEFKFRLLNSNFVFCFGFTV